jgi:oligoribonuclease NrnB/cAMP/cGMP phosphodiesterase (DHH superfamily)
MTDLLLDNYKQPLCLYHDDPDGRCAAAIVRRAVGANLKLHALEIGDPVPWEEAERSDLVVLVDYSLTLEAMKRLQSSGGFIWVDHHKSALKELGEAMMNVPGERSLDAAACELAWRTFFPGVALPQAVALIGDRDIWRMALPGTRQFGEGIYQEDMDPANDALWGPLLDDDKKLVSELTERGRLLYQVRLAGIVDRVDRYGFDTNFEGYRARAINDRGSGDMGEYIRQQGYELGYCYIEAMRDGELLTIVTLYSDAVDVSEIARKYGGGGHKGAAGFQFKRSDRPFPAGTDG